MSLVNDALKRAGKSQPKNPPPAAGPPLRLAHPTPQARNQDIMFSVLVVLILCLGGVLLWQWSHGGSDLKVRARTFSSGTALTTSSHPATIQAAAAPELPLKMFPVSPSETSAVVKEVVPESPKPLPPAYKLQSVLYLPGNPSAIINGKTVRIHGIVNNARVTAIGPGTATILTPEGKTRVLAIDSP